MLSIITLILAFGAHADWQAELQCSSVRLDAAGGSLSSLPVYDQGSLDTCYAYTAAQMADAYRVSTGKRLTHGPSSPLSYAVIYSAERRENGSPRPRAFINGGDVAWALRTVHASRTPICSWRAVDTRLVRHEKADRFFEALGQSWDRYHAARTPGSAAAESEALSRAIQSRGYPSGGRELEAALRAPTFTEFLNRLFPGACRNEAYSGSDLPEPYALSVHGDAGGSRESDFSRLLRANFSGARPQPVGLDYCADFLTKGDVARNLENDPAPGRPGHMANCQTPHASVVIGSRKRENECEFLIRNTFGPDCKGYDSRWQCEGGQIWVSERALLRNVNRAFVLGPGLGAP